MTPTIPRPIDPGDPAAFTADRDLDILVPTRNRPAELAATLAGLAAQEADFGVVVSDQSDGGPAWHHDAVAGMVRILRHRGHPVLLSRHLPVRGLAEHRAHLLAQSLARYVLFVDDDVWLEPGSVARLRAAIEKLGCGFVGNAPHGLSYVDDHRPEQEKPYQEWTGRPMPERIEPHGREWTRATVHSAANLLHIQQRLALRPGDWRAYKLSWLGACVLFDHAKLRSVRGYDFWPQVPVEHGGEDVLVQLRMLARYGGAGILPSGAYHLETPTTVESRDTECFDIVEPFD
jgi:GT2 family glycosyltransferase